MATSLLSSTRVQLIFAGVWIVFTLIHQITLAWLGLEWGAAGTDAGISNLMLIFSSLTIEGKLTSRSYTDKDGNQKWTTEIIVNELLLPSKK